MNRIRDFVGALVLAVSVIFATHQAVAQQAAPKPPSTKAESQARLRDDLRRYADDFYRFGEEARTKGACDTFQQNIRELITVFDDEYVRTRARVAGIYLPPAQRREIIRYAEGRASHLTALDCPPKTAVQTAQTTPPCGVQLQAGAGPSVFEGIDVFNGGFSANHNVVGPKFEGTLSVPLGGCLRGGWIFEARGFGFDGHSAKNLSGSGTTFLQANGNTQPVGIAGPVSSGRSEATITQLGAEMLFKLYSPPIAPAPFTQRSQFAPYFGIGFERLSLETKTSANWDPIGFFVMDLRETQTDRVAFFGGAEFDIVRLPDGTSIFANARGQLNLDFVEGSSTYDTGQTGIFRETLHHHFSKTAVTFGGEVGLGASKTFAGGTTIGVNVGVGAVPIYRLEFHRGEPATLENEHHLNFTAKAEIRIPLTGPDPFDFTDLIFRY